MNYVPNTQQIMQLIMAKKAVTELIEIQILVIKEHRLNNHQNSNNY